jgi:hypothetical protein
VHGLAKRSPSLGPASAFLMSHSYFPTLLTLRSRAKKAHSHEEVEFTSPSSWTGIIL